MRSRPFMDLIGPRRLSTRCVQVVAYFNYINRIAEGLGVAAEGWIDDYGRVKTT